MVDVGPALTAGIAICVQDAMSNAIADIIVAGTSGARPSMSPRERIVTTGIIAT